MQIVRFLAIAFSVLVLASCSASKGKGCDCPSWSLTKESTVQKEALADQAT